MCSAAAEKEVIESESQSCLAIYLYAKCMYGFAWAKITSNDRDLPREVARIVGKQAPACPFSASLKWPWALVLDPT